MARGITCPERRTYALLHVAAIQAKGESTDRAQKSLEEALAAARMAESLRLRVSMVRWIGGAQAERGLTDQAKKSFAEALSTVTARRFDGYLSQTEMFESIIRRLIGGPEQG